VRSHLHLLSVLQVTWGGIMLMLGVSTGLLARGESQSIVFTVPDLPGVYPYECGPHSQMMRGSITIE